MSPQPRLEQKYERKQNEKRAEQSAHHRSIGHDASSWDQAGLAGAWSGSSLAFRAYAVTASRALGHQTHMWIDLLPTARAASLTASVSVGWAWQVRAMSSAAAPNSIATAASAIMLPASGPMMWTPSTRSVLASARIFTKPSVCRLTLARPLAVNGNFPALKATPAAFSSSSDFPIDAISG